MWSVFLDLEFSGGGHHPESAADLCVRIFLAQVLTFRYLDQLELALELIVRL